MAQTIGSKAVGMAGQVVLAWLLMPADLGLWGKASIVMGFSGLIQQAGLRETLINRQRAYHLWANAAFWMSTPVTTRLILPDSVSILTIAKRDRMVLADVS